MRLLIQSAMIFFGTLLAAGLMALGEPTTTLVLAVRDAQHAGHWHQLTAAAAQRAR